MRANFGLPRACSQLQWRLTAVIGGKRQPACTLLVGHRSLPRGDKYEVGIRMDANGGIMRDKVGGFNGVSWFCLGMGHESYEKY